MDPHQLLPEPASPGSVGRLFGSDDRMALESSIINSSSSLSGASLSRVVSAGLAGPSPRSRTAYKLYPKRFVLLAIVVVVSIANNAMFLGFSSITKSVAKSYGVPVANVDYLAAVFMVAPLIFYFPAMYLTDRYGVSTCFKLGCFLGAVGSALRVYARKDFRLLLAGQAVCAVAGPFILDIPLALSERWFGEHERNLATAVGALSQFMGIGVGMGVAGFFKKDVQMWVLLQGVLFVVPALLGVLIFENKPPTPCGPTSAHGSEFGIWKASKYLLSSPWFLLLLTGVGMAVGACTALLTFIGLLLPTAIQDEAPMLCGLFFICGTIGGLVEAALAEMYKTLKTILRSMCFIATLCFLGMALGYQLDNHMLIRVCFVLTGFVGLGVVPLGLELGMECMFSETIPIEGTLTAFIFNATNIFGIVFVIALPPSTFADPKYLIFAYTGVLAVSCIIMFFFNDTYRRTPFQARRSNALAEPITSTTKHYQTRG